MNPSPAKWPPNTGLLRSAVYERILSDLELGLILPGEIFSLGKLAEALGIGKTPLRDALLELQTEGFVTLFPQRGVMVNELTEKDKRELYEVCGLLDSKVARNVFPRMSPEHIARLKAVNEHISPCANDLSSVAYARDNLAFHDIYLELEGNESMKKILRLNRLRLFQFSIRDWGPEFSRANYEEHNRIIQLFEHGTADELSAFMLQVHWSFNW